jgi:hypothetical protein
MSGAQNSLPASDAESVSAESAPDRAYELAAGPGREPFCGPKVDNGSDVSGHTLLSRPALPQGRRSLFRR